MAKHELDVPPVAGPELVHSVLQRVATGPELSKNISYEEAHSMMNALLQDKIDPVQAAVFLIGLRMKRETNEELKGLLDCERGFGLVEPSKRARAREIFDLKPDRGVETPPGLVGICNACARFERSAANIWRRITYLR